MNAYSQGVRLQWAQYQVKDQGILLQTSGNPGYIPGLPVRVRPRPAHGCAPASWARMA